MNDQSQNIDRLLSSTSRVAGKACTEDNLAITPERMSDELAARLVEDLDDSDFNFTDWDVSFIGSNLGRKRFSFKQKTVIYNLARKFKLI